MRRKERQRTLDEVIKDVEQDLIYDHLTGCPVNTNTMRGGMTLLAAEVLRLRDALDKKLGYEPRQSVSTAPFGYLPTNRLRITQHEDGSVSDYLRCYVAEGQPDVWVAIDVNPEPGNYSLDIALTYLPDGWPESLQVGYKVHEKCAPSSS